MHTRTDPRDESILGKLSSRTRRILEALARSETADAAVEAEQTRTTAERKALLDELTQLETWQPDLQFVQAVADARSGMAKAEKALEDARRRLIAADAALLGEENPVARRKMQLREELQNSADERLAQFIGKVRGITVSDLQLSLTITIVTTKMIGGRVTEYESNSDDMNRAMKACEVVISEALQAQLAPLDYSEVSQLLMDWCEQLSRPLAAVWINPPSLSSEHAEVGPPATWGGNSTWIVERVANPTRREALDEFSERVKARSTGSALRAKS